MKRFSSTSHLLGLLVGLLAAGTSFVASFTTLPPLPSIQRIRTIATTTRNVNTLTDQDEAVLFGGSSERDLPNPRSPNPLDHATNNPTINRLRTIRETTVACPNLWADLAKVIPDLPAVYDNHLCDTQISQTFQQFATSVSKSAGLFANLGVSLDTKVAIFGENSAHWLLVDQGIQLAGGATAVRGADAPLEELRYIYEHCDSNQIVVMQGPKLLQKLAKDSSSAASSNNNNNNSLGLVNGNGPVRTVILMHREKFTDDDLAQLGKQYQVDIQVFADLLQVSSPIQDKPKLQSSNLATIVYTSGTTGRPKGVMLTHGNLLHQIGHRLAPSQPYEESEPLPGETMVSLLPVWHITERTFELWMASRGCSIVYSSIRTFKKDLAKHKPQWLVLVPRVLEKIAAGVQDKFSSGSAVVKALSSFFTKIGQKVAKHRKVVNGLVVGDSKPSVGEELASRFMLALLGPLHALGNKLVWSKVQDGFGGNLKTIISGGSALAGGLETFYETAGMQILVGYGLTECSPLISFRRSDCNLVTGGCAGKQCENTELRIVDPAALAVDAPRQALPHGEAGLIITKGPQVMKGYYKNQEATDKAIDPFGWFDTGDLGRINPATGDLILTGRAKDTIVLSNGENIEPVPIEDAILGESPLVDQVMLTGQDGRSMIAVTVLNPVELANAGLLDRAQADKLMEANEKVNDPKCTPEDCQTYSDLLNLASVSLRSDKKVEKAISDVFRSATQDFRKWEKVSNFFLTLEPFAMVNGLLTQSYKVKRAEVVKRYAKELSLE